MDYQTLFTEVDDLMASIRSDTSRSQLPDLAEKVYQLSKIYWQAKMDLTTAKTKYDRERITKKEQRRQELERLEDNKLKKDEKYKKSRITNADIESMTELELITLSKEQDEPQMIVNYLEPIIRSVNEWIVNVRYVSKQNQSFSSFND